MSLNKKQITNQRNVLKKALLLCIVICSILPVFAQNTDTLLVQSTGYGASNEEAIKDALRNASEQSLGMEIASKSMIENYMVIRDVISTSANGYIYKYDISGSELDKNTNVYSVKINAYVAKNLLNSAVTAKITSDTMLNMSDIEKVKFEMAQAKERAKSSVVYYSAALQRDFRNNVKFKFDSLVVVNKDVVSMEAKIRIYYSFGLVDNIDGYIRKIKKLNERMYEFSHRRYMSSYRIEFERIDNETPDKLNTQRRSYEFGISQLVVPKTQKSKSDSFIVKYFTNPTTQNDAINKKLFSYKVCTPPCYIVNDSLAFPFLKFLNNDILLNENGFSRIRPNVYSNYIEASLPISLVTPDILKIKCSINVIERSEDSGKIRAFEIVTDNKDGDLESVFKEY